MGSTFTLYLPLTYVGPSAPVRTRRPDRWRSRTRRRNCARSLAEQPIERVPDDRAVDRPGDTVLLIVEDDPHYARIMVDLARDHGLQGAGCRCAAPKRWRWLGEYQPTAISLDVFLPDMLGWTVLSQLKQDPTTRHIPVQIVTLDEDRQHGLARGAFSFITKPTTTEGLQDALDADHGFRPAAPQAAAAGRGQRRRTAWHRELLGHDDIDIVDGRDRRGSAGACCSERAAGLRRARSAAAGHVGLRGAGADLRDDASLRDMPVVVFTGRELSPEEDAQLHTMARSVVVKGVESPERLLDETALFLHRVVADLPTDKQRMLERLHSSDEDLVGKTVLLVDDDARNIFALSQRAGAARHAGADRHHRARGDRPARGDAGCRDRADGHHDAGNGRL